MPNLSPRMIYRRLMPYSILKAAQRQVKSHQPVDFWDVFKHGQHSQAEKDKD